MLTLAPGVFQYTNKSFSEQLTWFGNLLPRLGFLPMQNLLIYGTAGLAFGHVEDSSNATIGIPAAGLVQQYSNSNSSTVPGWAVGAGAEWLITPHWSLSGEYLYNQLDNYSFIINGSTNKPATPALPVTVAGKTNYQTTELAINYRF